MTSTAAVPTLEYYQNEDNARMYRVRASAEDIGAFEYGTTGEGIGPGGDPFPDAGTGGAAGTGGSAGSGGVSGTGAAAGATSGPSAAADDDGGCGCRAGGTRTSSIAIFAVFAAALLLARRMHRFESR